MGHLRCLPLAVWKLCISYKTVRTASAFNLRQCQALRSVHSTWRGVTEMKSCSPDSSTPMPGQGRASCCAALTASPLAQHWHGSSLTLGEEIHLHPELASLIWAECCCSGSTGNSTLLLVAQQITPVLSQSDQCLSSHSTSEQSLARCIRWPYGCYPSVSEAGAAAVTLGLASFAQVGLSKH